MDTQSQTIRVSIFDEEYPLRAEGESDREYMSRVADHVDRAMRKIADRTPNLTTAKVAILAALNITDELYSERRDAERKLASLESRAQLLRERLESRLATPARPPIPDSPSRFPVSAN